MRSGPTGSVRLPDGCFRAVADIRQASYAPAVRPLWPIERAVLDATAQDHPALATALHQQAEAAHIAEFVNTGAGFFSTVLIGPDAPRLPAASPLDGAYGVLEGIEHGMGFVVFLENGRVSLIEGYSHGDTTTGINFAEVKFDLKPWSLAVSK